MRYEEALHLMQSTRANILQHSEEKFELLPVFQTDGFHGHVLKTGKAFRDSRLDSPSESPDPLL